MLFLIGVGGVICAMKSVLYEVIVFLLRPMKLHLGCLRDPSNRPLFAICYRARDVHKAIMRFCSMLTSLKLW